MRELAPAACRPGLPGRAPRTRYVHSAGECGSASRKKAQRGVRANRAEHAAPIHVARTSRLRYGARLPGVRELAPAVCRPGLPGRASRTRHVHRAWKCVSITKETRAQRVVRTNRGSRATERSAKPPAAGAQRAAQGGRAGIHPRQKKPGRSLPVGRQAPSAAQPHPQQVFAFPRYKRSRTLTANPRPASSARPPRPDTPSPAATPERSSRR